MLRLPKISGSRIIMLVHDKDTYNNVENFKFNLKKILYLMLYVVKECLYLRIPVFLRFNVELKDSMFSKT